MTDILQACTDCTTGLAKAPARVCDNCQPARLARQLEAYTGNAYPLTPRQEALPMAQPTTLAAPTREDLIPGYTWVIGQDERGWYYQATFDAIGYGSGYPSPKVARQAAIASVAPFGWTPCPMPNGTAHPHCGKPVILDMSAEPAVCDEHKAQLERLVPNRAQRQAAVKPAKQCPDCGAGKGVAHRDDCSVSREAPKGIDRSQVADASITDHPFTPWKTAPKRCNTCGKVAPRHAVVQA